MPIAIGVLLRQLLDCLSPEVREQRRIEAYYADATDLADLEHRMARVERYGLVDWP